MDGLIYELSSLASTHLDDMITFSSTREDHLNHLCIIFQRHSNAGLTIKVCKCKFKMTTYTSILVVRGGSLRPGHAKVEVIRRMPIPQTKTELRAFSGLTDYYRKFIPLVFHRGAATD